MKVYRKILTLGFLFVLIGLLFLALSSSVRGDEVSLNFTFEKDILCDLESLPINSTFNIRNQTSFSQTYNSTYSFNDDNDWSEPNGWISNNDVGCTTTVIPTLDGHDKVLLLNDTSSTGMCEISQSFSPQTSGIVEFWMRINSTNDYYMVEFYSSGTSRFRVGFRTGRIQYLETAWTYLLNPSSADVWYFIKLDFDCGVDTFDIYLNGEKKDTSAPFQVVSTNIDEIIISGIDATQDYSFYLDGLGYSWDNYYEINDVIMPLIESNETLEIDKFEFALEGINDLSDLNDIDPSGWTSVEVGGGYSKIVLDGTSDRCVEIKSTGNAITNGLTKQDFSITGKVLRLSFGLEFTDLSDVGGAFIISLESSDNTEVIKIRVLGNGWFGYYKGSYIELRNDLTTGEFYDFDLYIDYNFDICLLRYSVDNIFISSYSFPLMATGKQGLKEVNILTTTVTANNLITQIDYIGIYENGISQSDEFGYLAFDLENDLGIWDFEKQSLLNITAEGSFSLHAGEGEYNAEVGDFGNVFGEREYDSSNLFFNIFDSGASDIDNPFLVIYLSENHYFNNLSYIAIEGVKMIEGINEYPLEFLSSNIYTNESYFFVDSDNKLQFSLIVNDADIEYILARFDIIDVSSEFRSIDFKSDINGKSTGRFWIQYTDFSELYITLPTHPTTTSITLPNTKTIRYLSLIISDLDLETSDICEGYITNINLIYYPNVPITITTFNLLAILVPLIVMLVPPFAMYEQFGKNVLLPMFLLMSIICVITSIIPVWLFFVIVLSSIGFIVMEKKKEGSE